MRKIKSSRIVIKIGTNVLTNEKGLLDLKVIQNLVSQIAKVKNGRDIIVITSGAIGAGMQELGLKQKPANVIMKQVCAAIGQGILMASYYSLFSRHKIRVAQILLTYDDLSDSSTYRNLMNSIGRLFELGVVPIINENDPISINEIGPSFGDNDNLSAMIAGRMKADLLVILTDVEGLYDKNPKDKSAVLIQEVKAVDSRVEAMGAGSSELGIGGMKTKIEAAKNATKAGTTVIIANGRKHDMLARIINNESVGTIFYPH